MVRSNNMASPEEARIQVGATLAEKWRIDAPLGAGGMATVWAGTHRNGLKVAIKVLRHELSADQELRMRFLREGYVANRIEHPGVVQVLDDHVTDDGIVFFVMERLNGETLNQHWKANDKRLSPAKVVDIALEVLEVLKAAHSVGVVHRDLKPDNVFLLEGDETKVKLLDFGIARLREVGAMDQHTKTGTMLGTPAFMPPEQALGHWDKVDGRSDLFALGATMWTLLSGELVHQVTTVQELLVAACTKHARPIRQAIPDLDERLAAVIDKALGFEADDRWQSPAAMYDALLPLRGLAASPKKRAPAKTEQMVEVSTKTIETPTALLPAGGIITEPSHPPISVPQDAALTPGFHTTAAPTTRPMPRRTQAKTWGVVAASLSIIFLGVVALAVMKSSADTSSSDANTPHAAGSLPITEPSGSRNPDSPADTNSPPTTASVAPTTPPTVEPSTSAEAKTSPSTGAPSKPLPKTQPRPIPRPRPFPRAQPLPKPGCPDIFNPACP